MLSDFFVVKWLWSRFQSMKNSPINIKTEEMLEGDDLRGQAFVLFLRSHPRAFRQLMCPHLREFAHFFQKNANARGGGREGGTWVLLELTDA